MKTLDINWRVVTSVLFYTLSLHAMWKGLWAYGVALAALATTSILLHGYGLCQKIDQVLVYVVVALGAYYFYIVLNSFNVKRVESIFIYIFLAVPVATFIGCIILYHVFNDRVDHVWVHVLTLIGHHCILLLLGLQQSRA